jgi:hypothetical protein
VSVASIRRIEQPLIAGYLFDLFFECEEGGTAMLRNVSQFPPVYMAS